MNGRDKVRGSAKQHAEGDTNQDKRFRIHVNAFSTWYIPADKPSKAQHAVPMGCAQPSHSSS